MKKIVAILTLTLFTGVFAEDNSKVEKVHSLTKTEETELQDLHTDFILELRRERLFDR